MLIHMTGTMTNPMNEGLKLWQETLLLRTKVLEGKGNLFLGGLSLLIVHAILGQMYKKKEEKNVSSTSLLCYRFTQKFLLLLNYPT